jgi:hypothetical protein
MEKQSGNPFANISGEPLEGSGFETENPILEEQSTEIRAEQVPEDEQ